MSLTESVPPEVPRAGRAALVVVVSLITLPGGVARSAESTPAKSATSAITVRGGFPALRERLDNGREVHVAFLGGSITQNGSGHVAMVPAGLRERFPGVAFKVTNAGLSSTCSTSGAFRLAKDVLARGRVDLLVVEFAVNDDQDAAHPAATCVRGLEGIVRQLRRHNPGAAGVVVHFVNPGMLRQVQAGETPVPIAAHDSVAAHYGLPSVNVAMALANRIAAGEMTWKDYGGTHPNAAGYRLASDLVAAAIHHSLDLRPRSGDAAPSLERPLPPPLDPGHYGGGRLLPVASAELADGWRLAPVSRDLLPVGSIRADYRDLPALRADRPGDTLHLTFDGTAVGAFLLAGPDAGTLEARVDGGPPTVHDLYHRFSRGLNYPRTLLFREGLPPGKHRLELRVAPARNKASTGHAACLLGFAVNGPGGL